MSSSTCPRSGTLPELLLLLLLLPAGPERGDGSSRDDGDRTAPRRERSALELEPDAAAGARELDEEQAGGAKLLLSAVEELLRLARYLCSHSSEQSLLSELESSSIGRT